MHNNTSQEFKFMLLLKLLEAVRNIYVKVGNNIISMFHEALFTVLPPMQVPSLTEVVQLQFCAVAEADDVQPSLSVHREVLE
jgi:hypothetical protein